MTIKPQILEFNAHEPRQLEHIFEDERLALIEFLASALRQIGWVRKASFGHSEGPRKSCLLKDNPDIEPPLFSYQRADGGFQADLRNPSCK